MNPVTTLTEWAIPVVSLLALGVWASIFLRQARRHHPIVEPAYMLVLATVAVVAACLVVGALIYPGVGNAETSRFANSVGRAALLVGGVSVLWVGRKEVV